ncbi:MAG: class I SAM-dependent methyltransferase, partial [Pseudorhodobacter sp.]|nr:class I SAM-dependent methyltransferase [Rhizobacter sp.]
MASLFQRLPRTARRAREILSSYRQGTTSATGTHRCGTCGFKGVPLHRDALWRGLIQEWELTPDWARWMNQREGSRCAWCGSSLRSGQLANAIVSVVNAKTGGNAQRLNQLFRSPEAQALDTAEINSAGNLHRHLARCHGLKYSEFGSTSPNVPSQDLTALSYVDNSFDVVITADTLEHVPDIDRALREIHRVLRRGGTHVFSLPVVWGRATRQRATLERGTLTHHLPPSYHGVSAEGKSDFLVFNEFGKDFVARCENAGFELTLLREANN